MKLDPQRTLESGSKHVGSFAAPEKSSWCQGFIYSVLQRPMLPSGQNGFTAALVAAHPGAGTTHLSAALTELLNEDASGSATLLDCRDLATLRGDPRGRAAQSMREPPGSTALTCPPVFQSSWRGSRRYRAAYLAHLRERFSYVLIDCPSLKESSEVLAIAPLVDGVLLVIEANQTQKTQVANLERTIEGVGGTILGHLLNKRTYPIPEWVHTKLQRWGI